MGRQPPKSRHAPRKAPSAAAPPKGKAAAATNGHGHGAKGLANGHANHARNGHASKGHGEAAPRAAAAPPYPAPSPRLGAPRTLPVGDEHVFEPEEAAAAGPANQRIYLWSPRCAFCGLAMRGVAQVPAPAEGPPRGSINLAWKNVLCTACRNDNPLGPATKWSVVGGPLPVRR